MKKEKEYKKLGSGRYIMRSMSLWQAKDHLLVCENMGYSEEYKRFYFRDIQAVLVRENYRRMGWGFAWGGFMALWTFCLLATKEVQEFWFVLIGIFGLGFLVNLLMGKGCVCHLKTAVQQVEVPIFRVAKARKIMDKIKPLIDAAQAELPDLPAPVPVTPPAGTAAAPGQGVAVKEFQGGMHVFFFTFLLVVAALSAGRFFTLSRVFFYIQTLMGFAAVIPFVIALVRQRESNASKLLRTLMTLSLIYLCASYFLYMGSTFMVMMEHPKMANNDLSIMGFVADIGPSENGYVLFLTLFEVAGCLLLGTLGLLELTLRRGRSAAVPIPE